MLARVLLCGFALLVSCGSPTAGDRPVDMLLTTPGSGKLVHVVAFWLKSSAPAGLRAAMRDLYLERVATAVAGVDVVLIGTPQPSARDVVDDSFSCMSVVRFADRAAEVGWQTHPVHDTLKDLFGPWLERVVVYDFVE